MNSQESDHLGVAALCWAGEVGDEWQATVASDRPDASTTRRWP